MRVRVGTLAIPLETVETVELTPSQFEAVKLQILAVEQERYGMAAQYPPEAADRRAMAIVAAALSEIHRSDTCL